MNKLLSEPRDRAIRVPTFGPVGEERPHHDDVYVLKPPKLLKHVIQTNQSQFSKIALNLRGGEVSLIDSVKPELKNSHRLPISNSTTAEGNFELQGSKKIDAIPEAAAKGLGKLMIRLASSGSLDKEESPDIVLNRNAQNSKINEGLGSTIGKNFIDYLEFRMMQQKKMADGGAKMDVLFVTRDQYKLEQRESKLKRGGQGQKKILRSRTKRPTQRVPELKQSKSTVGRKSVSPGPLEAKSPPAERKTKIKWAPRNTVFVFPRDG